MEPINWNNPFGWSEVEITDEKLINNDKTLATGQLILSSESLNLKTSCSFIWLLQNKAEEKRFRREM